MVVARAQPSSNDHIFPPAGPAHPFIDFDGKGFLIDGKRTFLVSAGIEYARVPRDLWYDRLLRLKRAGFNCVEFYTIWNFHEPKEGQFDFSGDHDLEAFLQVVKKLGLYAIARVGPYYCAEWDNGGYPLWLRLKRGVRVREDDPAFEKYVDRYFDRLFPILCRNQIHRGGAIIMMQLENEHPAGWGTAIPNGYFRHLREKALLLGMEVPYFFSGLHHSSDPAGEAASLDDPGRPSPWFSTEFWSVWYNGYGSTGKEAREYERRTWKIIAGGGGGYNYYMAHGGSNFGYTNNDEDAASYDYGAAVGQAGDLRPIYYSFKRVAWFARSVPEILANGSDGSAEWKGLVVDTSIRLSVRHSSAGDIIFLDNPSAGAVNVNVRGEQVRLEGGEIRPIVHNYPLNPFQTLTWSTSRILGIDKGNRVTTIVLYGEAGDTGSIYLRVKGNTFITEGRRAFRMQKDIILLRARFPMGGQASVYSLSTDGRLLRVLAMNKELADRTWFLETEGRSAIATGPQYAGESGVAGKRLFLHTETRLSLSTLEKKRGTEYPVWIYGREGKPRLLQQSYPDVMKDGATEADWGDTVHGRLVLSPWLEKTAFDPAAQPGSDDHGWKYSGQPLPMEAGDNMASSAWYGAHFHADTAGTYTLQLDGGDRATVWVDGELAGKGRIREQEFPLTIARGDHVLTVFAAHDGRDKLAAYLGDIGVVDPKGISGIPRLLAGGPAIHPLGEWYFLSAKDPGERDRGLPLPGISGWEKYTIGQDAFSGREGFGWFRTALPAPGPGVKNIVLKFLSVDENATVYINGRKIARHEGWNVPFEISLGGIDSLQKPLELTLFLENYSNEGGIDRPVRANYTGAGISLTGWSMRGDLCEPGEGGFVPMTLNGDTSCPLQGLPGCFRAEFRAPAYRPAGKHYIWRVHTTGLGHGSVWVNGHNLGRYPEKTNAPGLYIPECWLQSGNNSLVVFDEDGRCPARVSVEMEKEASRNLAVMTEVMSAPDRMRRTAFANDPNDPLGYISPFIGTGRSTVLTKWGNEGGTYPGAVSPWGFMQLSPETRRGGGYDYADSIIVLFSCSGHKSGYPNGSAGELGIMPVLPGAVGSSGSFESSGSSVSSGSFDPLKYGRPFSHGDESASPGYYRVRFRDNYTMVEATATPRAGLFRFRFPPGCTPILYLKGKGQLTGRDYRVIPRSGKDGGGRHLELPALFQFSEVPGGQQNLKDGILVRFAASATSECVILVKVSASQVGLESAAKNLTVELDGMRGKGAMKEGRRGAAIPDFDRVREGVQRAWRKELSVVGIDDPDGERKQIFYTALYHSLLLPWVISDVEGNYRGADGYIHKVTGRSEYGGFSPWDTYRSLHPLLSLLYPDKQRDMVLSMLDISRQTGSLPLDPMTGVHAVPVIVDSYLKGICGPRSFPGFDNSCLDSSLIYTAIKKSIADTPYREQDMRIYRQQGFIPARYPESVTRTVEYAYDDWAFGQFTGLALHRKEEADCWFARGYNYRHLFDPSSLFLLPRQGDRFNARPGNAGYKEGDKWVYSYFAPQHPRDLVNLMGGDSAFSERLDSALRRQDVLFDNETVFHIPYLFNYANRPDLTRHWVRTIMGTRFSATPGGLPGNDDLGAMSSWYIFSALGFYPVCPGRPVYDIGAPLFRAVTLHLHNGRSFFIRADDGNGGNHVLLNSGFIPHELVAGGGEMIFTNDSVFYRRDREAGAGRDMSAKTAYDLFAKPGYVDSVRAPAYRLTDYHVSRKQTFPHEQLWLHFTIQNTGGRGVKILELQVNGKEYARRNCLVEAGASLTDSMPFELYAYGIARLAIDGMPGPEVEVLRPERDETGPMVSELTIIPSLKAGERQSVSYRVQNISGVARRYIIPVVVNDSLAHRDSISLEPGESGVVSWDAGPAGPGWYKVRVQQAEAAFKVYDTRLASIILDLSADRISGDGVIIDGSGFRNNAVIVRPEGRSDTAGRDIRRKESVPERQEAPLLLGKNCYLEVPNALSLDRMGETITMMTWVYPVAISGGLTDLFTKGDNHVLQVVGNRQLSFFAGGWGRGDCTVDLPVDWLGHWHHIAGVCEGSKLRVYIDGKLAGEANVGGRVNLSVYNKWTFGRNEEFPDQRIFNGYMDKMKVYRDALTAEDISAIMQEESGRFRPGSSSLPPVPRSPGQGQRPSRSSGQRKIPGH